ncbi:heterogeneous nuclear ribonucleoprotein R-like isoform X1 [Penaeus japonicus]|uniref:heterogeneous nuclear ribonucleoprotein R-like isoform X1 n=1 Tax=Penaeus japonicus TaxID=27405 RepID=UPI001C70BCA3|nr:heterogeneous nuclear ribonucleoprotein R-like isoform X1 [Penaeus japonicus]
MRGVMAEGNGGGDPGSQVDGERTEDYQKLINYGLNEKVAAKLDEIYKQGKLRHEDLDERALDALKEFPVEGAVTVLKQFLESNLEHVSNKSAYLCGVMKTYRQRKQYNTDSMTVNPGKGPDEDNLKAILERSGYTLDVTTGQRKYGGPPPNWEGPPPGPGCEVFCGKIPKELYEDELIPLFEKCGEIWDLRLMMDPMTGQNRGYAFITFTTRAAANEAVSKESSYLLQLNEYEIQRGKKLGVTISYNNHRLFVGNIPKNRERHELYEEFAKHAPGLVEVIIYSSPDDKKKNRGFCFLEYESHKAASLAKRRLSSGRFKVWGCEIIVDWADPQEEPDEDTMSKVKVLYVRNLTQVTTEEMLKEKFDEFGKVERVKKIKDYAFVHFEEREEAVKAMEALQGKDIGGALMEISLAKPPSDKKKKEEVLRNREKRLMQMLAQRGIAETDHLTGERMPVPPAMLRGGRGGGRGGGRSDYDYDYDYYGYGDYQGGYSDPYYDDYYRYEDYYYDYSPQPMGRGRTKSVPAGRGYGMASRGRGAGPSPRGGRGMVPRGGAMGGRMTRPPRAGQGFRGSARGANLAGKRKLDGGHQNEGDSKRRFQNTGASWGNQPIPQQPLSSYSGANGSTYGGAGGDQQWYHDSYPQSWS